MSIIVKEEDVHVIAVIVFCLILISTIAYGTKDITGAFFSGIYDSYFSLPILMYVIFFIVGICVLFIGQRGEIITVIEQLYENNRNKGKNKNNHDHFLHIQKLQHHHNTIKILLKDKNIPQALAAFDNLVLLFLEENKHPAVKRCIVLLENKLKASVLLLQARTCMNINETKQADNIIKSVQKIKREIDLQEDALYLEIVQLKNKIQHECAKENMHCVREHLPLLLYLFSNLPLSKKKELYSELGQIKMLLQHTFEKENQKK